MSAADKLRDLHAFWCANPDDEEAIYSFLWSAPEIAAVIEAAERVGDHERDCVAYAMPGRSCDCGRDDALGIALANLKRKLDA